MSRSTLLLLLAVVLLLLNFISADFAPAPGPTPTPPIIGDDVIDIIDTIAINTTEIIPVFSGNWFSGFQNPTSVLIVNSTNVVVVDSGDRKVKIINGDGVTYTLAGNGIIGGGSTGFGPTSSLDTPTSAVLDDEGYLLFTDTNNDLVRKVQITTAIMENFVGSGNKTQEYESSVAYNRTNIPLKQPKGLAFYDSTLYITSEDKVFKVEKDGSVGEIELLNITDTAHPKLNSPIALAMSSSDILYICDTLNHLIRRYNVTSKTLDTIVGTGDSTSENDSLNPLTHNLNSPMGLAVSSNGKRLYISDYGNKKIKVYNVEDNIIRSISTSGVTINPVGLYIHSNGSLYFTDVDSKQVGRIDLTCGPYSSSPLCLTSCFGIPSNDSSVCSGKGVCASIDKCICREGSVGNRCQFNSNFIISPDPSSLSVELGKSSVLKVTVLENINDTIKYSWACDECGNSVDNLENSLLFNPPNLGIFRYTVKASHLQDGTVIRTSNSINITITVIPSTPNNTVNSTTSSNSTFDSVALVSGIKSLPLSQNQMLDNVLTGFNVDSKKYLTLINQNECNTCSNILTISWKLIYEEKTFASDQINTRGVATKFYNYTNISLKPFVNIKGMVKLEGSSNQATLSFAITSDSSQNTMVINSTIPVFSPIFRSVSNFNIDPPLGVALYTLFSITEPQSNWNLYSADQYPLSFAIGIVYNNQTVRLTEFVPMGQQLLTYLPFTKYMEQNKQADLVIFAKDNLSNIQSSIVSSVVTMSRFYSTPSDLMNSMQNDSRIARLVPYDSSFTESTEGFDQLMTLAMQNVSISEENPSSGILSLYSLSEKNISTSVSNLISHKLGNFIGTSLDTYKTQKNQQGFVSSKVSDDNTKTILSTASNLMFKGADNTLVTKLSSLLVISSISSLLTSKDIALPSSTITSANINITYSSFSKEAVSTLPIANQFDSISFDADSILSQYSSFSTEVGLSVISFNGIVYPDINSTFATNAKDFTMYKNGNNLNLNDLQKAFSISFNLNSPISNYTTNRVICKYWNETMLKWDTNGCSLKTFNSTTGEIICSCTHTTLFSAFIEQSPVAVAFEPYVDQFIGVYGTQIALGAVYLICAIVILIALALNANKQPVKSRFVTPFLGMVALAVQSSLLLIVQRSVLISATRSNDANTYYASSVLANVITIIVNTITLCAIMTYLYQVVRFESLKYFYNEISSMNDKVIASRFLHFVKGLISSKFYTVFLITFAILNLAYWTLWVILVRTNVISGIVYSQIVSISYTVIILMIGFAVCCIFAVDTVLTWYQRQLYKDESTNRESETQKMKYHNILDKVTNFLFSWFIQADTPLFFRTEMILFVVSFIFLVIVQALGMASLNYRILLAGFSETKLAPLTIVRTVVAYDSVSIIFEVLYIVTYLFVYGGYSLLVLFIQRMKGLRDGKKEEEKEEITLHLENPVFLKIFETFCRKEFSLENLQLYILLSKNTNIIEKDISEIINFVEKVYEEYVKSGSIREINIPSDCRKSFASMVVKLKTTDNLELVDEKKPTPLTRKNSLPENLSGIVVENLKSLTDQILINLSDTFSRFYYSADFEKYSASNNSKEDLMKQSNLM